MKIWKQCTGLALSLLLIMSCMIAGAGAAFIDNGQIKHTEAVEQCVELNIISGLPDGSFRPGNNVTRAEMCKMLCVLLNGGKEPTLGTNSTPTFSDVRQSYARWAEPYIEDCYRRGIVSGVGGGHFNPNGNVTFEQASKMLLVALGNSGGSYTGSSWSSAVRADAKSNGFYNELSGINGSAPLSRDDAAQLIWNALQARTVKNSGQTLMQACYGRGETTPVQSAKPSQMIDYIGMSKKQLTDLWGTDYEVLDWTHAGAEEGFFYEDLRIPAEFFFYDGVVKSIFFYYPLQPGFRVTETLTGGETYEQMRNAGVTAALETDQDEISFDYEQLGMVMFDYKEKYLLWFSWQTSDPYSAPADCVIIIGR